MRRFLILALVFLLLASCKESSKLDGLWFLAYSKVEGEKPYYSGKRLLLHIDGSDVYTISVGNFGSGKLNEIIIDTSEYHIGDSVIRLWSENLQFTFGEDSLIMSHPENQNEILVWNSLKKMTSETSSNAGCISGAYHIKSVDFSDTIDFINDSILIHTGVSNVNWPTESWGVFKYYDIDFFLFNSGFQSWMAPVTMCTGDTILFENLYRPKHVIEMFKIESVSRQNQLIGTWRQGPPDSILKLLPPPLPRVPEIDRLIKMTFHTDSVTIYRYGRPETLKWDLTSDGKRIYFIDKIKEKWGSGKIVRLTDDHLFLRMSGNSMEEDTLKLFRVQ
ncbi:hypothetical protein [Owenweeksia hongkongensis]|uniref:hypothetical protein n=1 Tax=Owenweeksia hongkongensis TaxID=253245 RepID=UPI003A94BD1C